MGKSGQDKFQTVASAYNCVISKSWDASLIPSSNWIPQSGALPLKVG